MILVIDNYDSFTYNLVHLIGQVETDIIVHRNDQLTAAEAVALEPEAIILSPGPCTPNEAGICVSLTEVASARHIPLFGVCLGHQSIAQAFGAKIMRASNLMHGKTSRISHNSTGLFTNLPNPFTATRYHSLTINRDTLPSDVNITATSTDDNEIMALEIKDKPIYGVQFHPESISTEHGAAMIRNFLKLSRAERPAA